MEEKRFLLYGGNLEVGVVWGNVVDIFIGGKLKYEFFIFFLVLFVIW